MRTALALLALLAPALAGCLTGEPVATASLASLPAGVFDSTGDFSRTLLNGTLETLPVEVVDLPSFDGTLLSMGIYRPDTDEKVPVIVDAGPYYANGDVPVDQPADRLGRFLIENFVPHGYAVVQASIRGTGWSHGCGDFMGLREQLDMDALVTYLGEEPWSNGAVALIGRSYDGSTPWMAAQFGNPHLRTIVPISGLSDVGDLYYHNGSSEARAPTLGTYYALYGLEPNGRSARATAEAASCLHLDPTNPQGVLGSSQVREPSGPAWHAAWGTLGTVNGGGSTPAADAPYWEARNFRPAVMQHYRGSVFVIHGLQDWNVEPSMVVPWFNELRIEKKMWLGQWGHHYPDRPDEHEHLRWDFAETLLRWFDHELKGRNVDTGPVVEVEDNRGRWRTETSYPPLDAAFREWNLTVAGNLTRAASEEGEITIFAPATVAIGAALPDNGHFTSVAVFESPPLARDLRIAGLPQLHVTVRPSTPGGHLYARLWDVDNGTEVLLGHAQMDLRYHRGGRVPVPLVAPGAPVLALMEFFPLDAHVPAGHVLRLEVTQEVGPEPMPSPLTGPVALEFGPAARSVLRLPLVERAPPPSAWDHGHEAPTGD